MFFKRKKDNKQKQCNYQFPVIEGMDEYLWEAAKVIIDKQMASIGLLQRIFKIGFNRALRIMEQLETLGVVGEDTGIKPRKILVDIDGIYQIAQNSVNIAQNTEKNLQTNIGKPLTQEERVSMYNNHFDYMTGEDFEVFVAQVLRKIGFTGIQLTKGSGDQGVDIIAERDGIKYAIQCKRYSQAVGNKAVQEVFAGKTFYHCHVGVVVTNNYFTQSAKDLAKENGVVLWDKDFLNKHVGDVNTEISKENVSNNSLKILDAEEKIVAIEDGGLSKALYHYLEVASRNAIDRYLQNGDGNPYTEDMIKCAEKPIQIYNAHFDTFLKHICFVYYCTINFNFKFTNAYKKLSEISRKNNEKYKDNLFKINVYYGIEDIILEEKEIKISKIPQVDISTDTIEGIELLEEIDDYQKVFYSGNKVCYKGYITENFFVIKADNVQFGKNKNQEENMENKEDEILLEKRCFISQDFVTISLKSENKIEILGNCNTAISAANIYLGFSVKLKEECVGKIDFSVAVKCEENMAIASFENGVEFFGGEEDGEPVLGIPKWIDEARNKLLNSDKIEFLKGVEEVNSVLDEFMESAIKYIK